MKIKSELYDILKRIAMLYLPAAGTLYFTLAQIWHLPAGDEVVGSITAIDTFLGIALHLSSASYSGDGSIVTKVGDQGQPVMSFTLNTPPEELTGKKSVLFTYRDESPQVSVPTPVQ